MTIEHGNPQLDSLRRLEQFEKMMKLIKQFPVKENNIQPRPDKWELYPKYPKVSPK